MVLFPLIWFLRRFMQVKLVKTKFMNLKYIAAIALILCFLGMKSQTNTSPGTTYITKGTVRTCSGQFTDNDEFSVGIYSGGTWPAENSYTWEWFQVQPGGSAKLVETQRNGWISSRHKPQDIVGTYQYYAKCTSKYGKSVTTLKVSAIVYETPDVTINASTRDWICEGDSVSLTVPYSSEIRYQWSDNNGPIGNADSNQFWG